jgi:DNA (cytosine-5)-methyltransferase 1
VEEPLDSVTTKDRFLLINPATNEQHELEIYFRLLKPGELAAAHSFPKRYKFAGNKTQIVKQIGNSNPTELTAALTGAVM